jgi:hypothetical protein
MEDPSFLDDVEIVVAKPLPPDVEARVRAILHRWARRVLAERLAQPLDGDEPAGSDGLLPGGG